MTFSETTDDISVLAKESHVGLLGPPGATDVYPFPSSLLLTGSDAFHQGFTFGASHLGEEGEHDPSGGVPLAGGEQGFDSLLVPVQGDPKFLQFFNGRVGDTRFPSKSGNFVNQHFPNHPSPSQIHDAANPRPIFCIGGTRNLLSDHLNHFIARGRGILGQFADLTVGFLPTGGNSDKDGNGNILHVGLDTCAQKTISFCGYTFGQIWNGSTGGSWVLD